jgi:thiol:disulfide interchange protein
LKRSITVKRVLLSAVCSAVIFAEVLPQGAVSASLLQTGQATADGYDPKRDPEKDIQDAVAEAQRTHKRILLEVGGEWCSWCHTMDRYFAQHPTLLEFREQNFVTVRINFSRENENKKLLARYPEIPGYPHLFVLEATGKLLHSQNTEQLESGKSYDLEKFFAFLKRWAVVARLSDRELAP